MEGEENLFGDVNKVASFEAVLSEGAIFGRRPSKAVCLNKKKGSGSPRGGLAPTAVVMELGLDFPYHKVPYWAGRR